MNKKNNFKNYTPPTHPSTQSGYQAFGGFDVGEVNQLEVG